MEQSTKPEDDVESENEAIDRANEQEDIFVVGDINLSETSESLYDFVGCGAHRLNNCILDSVKKMPFFVQLNNFCMLNDVRGPKLSNTRWYGHSYQLDYVVNHKDKLEEKRAADLASFLSLDTVSVTQMNRVHENLRKMGRFFETNEPITDSTIVSIRQLQKACELTETQQGVHETVREFMANLKTGMSSEKRFRSFSKGVLACCLLNPSKQAREMLSDAEISSAKQYLLQYEKLTDVPIDVGELLNEPTTSTSDPIEKIFENACPIPAKRIATTCHALTLETELETFLQTIDDQACAFDFFKSHINQKSFPRLSEVARFVLGILPSPAVCEQNFSRAAILTENRRNKLSMLSVKNRLILS